MEQINSWLESFQAPLQAIGYTLGTIAIIILGIVLVTSGQDGISKGKRFAVGIIAGICIISFGTAIVSSLQG